MYLGSTSTCFIRRLKEHGANVHRNRHYAAAREATAWEHWSKGVLIDFGKVFENLPISAMMVNAMEVALNVLLDATGGLGLNRNVTGKKELKNGWNFRCASDGPPRFLDLSSGTAQLYQSIQPVWWWRETWIKLSVATVQGKEVVFLTIHADWLIIPHLAGNVRFPPAQWSITRFIPDKFSQKYIQETSRLAELEWEAIFQKLGGFHVVKNALSLRLDFWFGLLQTSLLRHSSWQWSGASGGAFGGTRRQPKRNVPPARWRNRTALTGSCTVNIRFTSRRGSPHRKDIREGNRKRTCKKAET